MQNSLPNKALNEMLLKFDMISERGHSTGLVFVDDKRSDPYEIIALEYAKKYGATAVYFRKFDDGRPPIPQIYIYDYTESNEDEQKVGELYKKLWNSGQVPLFFIFYKTEIKIFNCLKAPEVDRDTAAISSDPFLTINLAAKVKKELEHEQEKIEDFSAKRFDNGTFWSNSKYKNKFSQSETAYLKLLNELKRLRKKIIESNTIDKQMAQKLLVMSILVKYLEEREDEHGAKVFPPGFFQKFCDGNDFISALKKQGACLELFDYLGSDKCFNGNIFKWKDEKERALLKATDLTDFAVFFEGKVENNQYSFWRLYSFNDLPIEIISNIYEEFLESKEGVVYTPPYLVNFLIDEQMPLNDTHKINSKVLDPACGSGVFLVAAFRRMIQWWRIRNNWKKPGVDDLSELKNILKSNIFGVDKEEEAVRLTFFSLSLALLDELSPKVIWENLKFDNLLESNLICSDFFKLITAGFFKDDFDIVIGNPPFVAKLTPAALDIEKQNIKIRPKLPHKQIALLFLEQAMRLCKEDGAICLIIPAGSFLYNHYSLKFRNYFLSSYHVPQLIDFTFLSSILFESSNVAVVVVFAKKQAPVQKDILHVTVRRTKPAKEKLFFEIDHYDFHRISYNEALENRLIWKSNLLGGGRLKHIMARFTDVRTLGGYLKYNEKKYSWKIAEGFKVGKKTEIDELIELEKKIQNLSEKERLSLTKLKKKYERAEYLTGKYTLPENAFTYKGIDDKKIYILNEAYFHRSVKTKKEIFLKPHLLIKEGVAKKSIPIEFRNDNLSFRHGVIGIHAPEKVELLREIEKRIKNNRTYLFYVAAFSGSYMVSRATAILKKDIESLPYPEDEKELELTDMEQILVEDVLDYMLDFRGKGENSIAEKPVSGEKLDQFSDIYCKVLNSVYKEFRPYKPLKAKTGSFICLPFYYKDKPEILEGMTDELEDALYTLIQNNVNRNSRIIRILRMYEGNTIYLVKPNQARYWLKSIAIRDADETFGDLIIQGKK